LSGIEIDNYSPIDVDRNPKKLELFDRGEFHMLDIDSFKENNIPNLIGEIKDNIQFDIKNSASINLENYVPNGDNNNRISIEKDLENQHDITQNNSVRKKLLKVFTINLWS
jgi:hypothetical protein